MYTVLPYLRRICAGLLWPIFNTTYNLVIATSESTSFTREGALLNFNPLTIRQYSVEWSWL